MIAAAADERSPRAGGGAAGAAPPGPGRRPAHYARPGGWRWKVRAPRPLPAAPGVPPLSPPPGTHLRRAGAAPARPDSARLGSARRERGGGGQWPPAGPEAAAEAAGPLCRPPHRARPRGARPPPAPLGSAAPQAPRLPPGQVAWGRAAAARGRAARPWGPAAAGEAAGAARGACGRPEASVRQLPGGPGGAASPGRGGRPAPPPSEVAPAAPLSPPGVFPAPPPVSRRSRGAAVPRSRPEPPCA